MLIAPVVTQHLCEMTRELESAEVNVPWLNALVPGDIAPVNANNLKLPLPLPKRTKVFKVLPRYSAP